MLKDLKKTDKNKKYHLYKAAAIDIFALYKNNKMEETTFNNHICSMRPYLIKHAHVLLADDSSYAEDLAHDTILKMIEHVGTINSIHNIKAWSFRIMKNIYLNYRRSKIHEKNFITPEMQHDAISKASYIDGTEFRLEIADALKLLPEKYSMPLKLSIHGYSYIEIANAQGISVATVKKRIFTARDILRTKLKRTRY